jgi:hypothetical protein
MIRSLAASFGIGLMFCACAAVLGIEAGETAPRAGGGGADQGQGGGGSASIPWPEGDWDQRRILSVSTAPWPPGSFSDVPIAVPLPAGVSPEVSDEGVLFALVDGTVLAHELEHGNSGITAWLRIPELAPPATLELFLYEGGERAATPSAVWNGDYEGVWHLRADLGSAPYHAPDSTAHEHHAHPLGVLRPALTSGSVGDALSFDGIPEQSYGVDDDPGLAMGEDSFTVSFWLFPRIGLYNEPTVLWRGGAGTVPGYMVFRADLTTTWRLRIADSTDARVLTFAGDLEDRWTHFAFVVDRPGDEVRTYVSGVETDSQPIGNLLSLDGDEHLQISRRINQPYAGNIDELRIERTVRSPAEIALLHATSQDISERITPGEIERRP